MNTLKTAILMAALTALLVLLGRWIGGQEGMILAFLLALGMNFFSYWFSDKMVLAMTRARPLDSQEAPELYALVRRLAERAGVPMPRLYLVPDDSPNAFATGRDPNHAAIAVNQGLLRILDQPEVEGVLAHELSHVKHRDILISTIAATMAGALTLLAQMGQFGLIFGGYDRRDDDRGGNPLGALLLIIVAPIAAMLIQFAISRSREYAADEGAARLTGQPMNLAHALLRLEQATTAIPSETANPATAHMYIVNPLRGGGVASWFSTHPSTADRVARLQELDRAL
jgi:heat shock protein HtpX